DVDTRLGHLWSLKGLGGALEPPLLHILQRGVLQLWGGAGDIAHHLSQADDPLRQPAMPDLCHGSPQIGTALKEPRHDPIGAKARRTPGMGGGPGHCSVPPNIAIAGEIWRFYKEAVMDQG